MDGWRSTGGHSVACQRDVAVKRPIEGPSYMCLGLGRQSWARPSLKSLIARSIWRMDGWEQVPIIVCDTELASGLSRAKDGREQTNK